MSKDLKRKRVADQKSGFKKQKVQQKQGPKKSVAVGPIVRSDALKWKEASLPDRLDDAEGFFGLEELDDVEVVKDESTGLTSFRPRNVDAIVEGGLDQSTAEEWSGFEDEVATSTPKQSKTDAVDTGNKTKPKQQPKSVSKGSTNGNKIEKASKKDKAVAVKPADVVEDISFQALEEEVVQDVEEADVTAWEELNLSADTLGALSTLGYSDPTPVQRAAIPPILEGRDVIGKAVTGSGKTLAFGIPILENWLSHKTKVDADGVVLPVAFILAPTRELAHQLNSHMTALCKSLDPRPRIASVTGGLSVIKQQRQLETADIIIGTPGRLWEVINSSHGLISRLKQVRFLVIDEADRLLSEGHFKEVEEILSVLDRKVTNEDEEGNKSAVESNQRQTLIFSATFHKGLQQKLASKQKWQSNNDTELLSNAQSLDYLLRKLKFQKGSKPTFVDANPTSQMAENLTESILECGAMQKDLYLYSLLLLQQHEHQKLTSANSPNRVTRTLVFTNSISTVKRLVPLLNTLSIPSAVTLALHSAMPQKSRLRSLERFTTPPDKKTTTAILISTDVAARGLDIKGIDTIIHYHVPRAADGYVHRSGRTARSDKSGRSILICSPEEVAGVTRLVTKVHSDKNQETSSKKIKAAIQPLYLPASLPTQLSQRVSLAQKVASSQLDTSKTKSEENWLRTAADELGVDYNSEDFEETSNRTHRGRGGGREKKKRENVENASKGKVAEWKAELREDLNGRKIDFGDGEGVRGGKYLAGGAVDVERLLREKGGLRGENGMTMTASTSEEE